MGCNCGGTGETGRQGRPVLPDTPCVFCAHKHIAAARQLYDLEIGYRDINKSYAIGQLMLAAWHYEREHHNLALRCRDVWLGIERLEDVAAPLAALQEAAWRMVVAAADASHAQGGGAEAGRET